MANFIDNDPLLGGYQQERSQLIEEYRRKVEFQGSRTPYWDKIDAEISSLSDEQKKVVLEDSEYSSTQQELAQMIQEQLLKIVKPQIEGSEAGQKLLQRVYDATIVAKRKAIQQTNQEMELFKQWQNYAVAHPEATYQQFIEAINKSKKSKS